ncbi:hypothetical protein [uncultured Azohydromonas sp.]|nr:hypothetical protein [uncultured Azohydromonas sp.]
MRPGVVVEALEIGPSSLVRVIDQLVGALYCARKILRIVARASCA